MKSLNDNISFEINKSIVFPKGPSVLFFDSRLHVEGLKELLFDLSKKGLKKFKLTPQDK